MPSYLNSAGSYDSVTGSLVGTSQTQTLTNKAVTRRVVTLTDAATVTPNADTTDIGLLTSVSQSTTIANPSGTPVDGQSLVLRIKSSSAQTLTFGSAYRASSDLALPSATTGSSKTDYFGFIYNSADSKFDYLAKTMGF